MAYYDNYIGRELTGFGHLLKRKLNYKFFEKCLYDIEKGGLKILEVGVGRGLFAEKCLSEGNDYTGIEPNPTMFARLREKKINVIQTECPPIPLPDETFDFVFCGYLLENLPNAETVYKMIMECKRVLKPEGRIAVACHDYMKLGDEFFNVGYMNNYVTTRRRIMQIFFDAGISYQRSYFFTGVFFGFVRYFINIFWLFYRYEIYMTLGKLFERKETIDRRTYKVRASFAPGFLVIGNKGYE